VEQAEGAGAYVAAPLAAQLAAQARERLQSATSRIRDVLVSRNHEDPDARLMTCQNTGFTYFIRWGGSAVPSLYRAPEEGFRMDCSNLGTLLLPVDSDADQRYWNLPAEELNQTAEQLEHWLRKPMFIEMDRAELEAVERQLMLVAMPDSSDAG
jgi:hypothetical protein